MWIMDTLFYEENARDIRLADGRTAVMKSTVHTCADDARLQYR